MLAANGSRRPRQRMSTVTLAMKIEQVGREERALPQPTTMVGVARVDEQRGEAAWGA